MPAVTAHVAPGAPVRIRPWAIATVAIVALLGPAMASNARAGIYVIDNCPSAPIPNGDPGPQQGR